jgi:hypothetical protein
MNRTKERSKTAHGMGLMPLVLACLLALSPASAAVKLNLWTSPDSGDAGSSFVNLTGSGFPTANGTISPGNVSISLSLTCGGSIAATTTASSVKLVTGSSYRIQFELPGSLSTSSYFVSISGTTSDTTSFSSSNCSEVNVTAPSNGWTTLISRSWTLTPGQQFYVCRAIQIPTDIYITSFRAISPPGNYWTVLTVSDTPFTATGDYNCSAGSGTFDKQGFYAAGLGTNDLVFPTGVAVHLKAGQYINMNLHVTNAHGTMDLTGPSGVQVQTTSAANVTEEAEMIMGGTFTISIPSDGMIHTAQGGCNAPQDFNIFAAWPHMHSLGERINLFISHAGVAQDWLDVNPYSVNTQLEYPLTPPVLAHAGDSLTVTCEYVNNTGTTVSFGDSSTAEQCFMGLYIYPIIPGSNTFSCTSM